MRRPRNSHCPAGQDFVMGNVGKLVPIHTPRLGATCHCGACLQSARWTPEARAARSADYRAKAAAGVQFGSRKPKAIASRWLPEHDAVLDSLLGTLDTATIAQRLTARFSWPRTEGSVRARIKMRKLSRLTVRPWSRAEVARALGVSYYTVSTWVARGWLTGTPWKLGGGQRPGAISQAFTVADVERFIRAHGTVVQPATIRDTGLRAFARAVTRGAGPLTLPEAARAAGVTIANVRYWVGTGKVPSAHQVDGRSWRISAADVPLLRSMPDLRTRDARMAHGRGVAG